MRKIEVWLSYKDPHKFGVKKELQFGPNSLIKVYRSSSSSYFCKIELDDDSIGIYSAGMDIYLSRVTLENYYWHLFVFPTTQK
jgi:hypothetical protein